MVEALDLDAWDVEPAAGSQSSSSPVGPSYRRGGGRLAPAALERRREWAGASHGLQEGAGHLGARASLGRLTRLAPVAIRPSPAGRSRLYCGAVRGAERASSLRPFIRLGVSLTPHQPQVQSAAPGRSRHYFPNASWVPPGCRTRVWPPGGRGGAVVYGG